MKAFFLLTVFLHFTCLAQNSKLPKKDRFSQQEKRQAYKNDFEREIEEMERLLENAFGNSDALRKRFEDMHHQFFNDEIFKDDFFTEDFFNRDLKGLYDQYDRLNFDIGRDFEWVETDKEKILKFKFKPVKNSPMDIKVTEDRINIVGTSEYEKKTYQGKGVSVMRGQRTFNKTIPVPPDVDGSKAIIEKGENDLIQIRLPKKKPGKAKPSKPRSILPKRRRQKNIPDRRPLRPDKSDITI